MRHKLNKHIKSSPVYNKLQQSTVFYTACLYMNISYINTVNWERERERERERESALGSGV